MKSIFKITGIVPIFIFCAYAVMFLCVDMQPYLDLYYTRICFIDNILVGSAIAMFILGGFRNWTDLQLKAFGSVILLNALTELSFKTPIHNYYIIYAVLMSLFIVTLVVAYLDPTPSQT